MNLYLRFLILLIKSFAKPKLELLDSSILKFRVLPNDLDLNMHMNNGRYLSIMDLGRTDLLLRIGLGQHLIENKWMPIVGHLHMRYRRPLKAFQYYELLTRIVTWDEKWVYLEQRFISNNKCIAVGLVQGLIRGKKGNIPTYDLLALVGFNNKAPDTTEDIQLLKKFQNIE